MGERRAIKQAVRPYHFEQTQTHACASEYGERPGASRLFVNSDNARR
jgi:hypothetical protein